MSKLLKLKSWLTIDDAARHLSIMFGEEVTKADILRLAADGRLTLSVNIVNGAPARCGPVVAAENARYTEFPSDLKAAMRAKSPGEYQGGYVKVPRGVRLDNGDVIDLADDVVSLRGVYDLPMIGNEHLDVEHRYQTLTDGPPVTLQGLDGAFVVARDGTYCQLQESYDDNQFSAGSEAQGRQLETFIANEGIEAETAEEMRAKYRTKREQFEKQRADRPAKESYFPAGGLPPDSVLVVRTDALLKLHEDASAPERRGANLGTREQDTLLKLVIGMAIVGYGYSAEAARSEKPGEIANDLASLGISVTDDTVRKWLKAAAAAVLPGKPSGG